MSAPSWVRVLESRGLETMWGLYEGTHSRSSATTSRARNVCRLRPGGGRSGLGTVKAPQRLSFFSSFFGGIGACGGGGGGAVTFGAGGGGSGSGCGDGAGGAATFAGGSFGASTFRTGTGGSTCSGAGVCGTAAFAA